MPENFKGYTVYGPYLGQAEQRRLAVLVKDDHRTTMSWARYMMCKHLDRWLEKDEHVDHINNDQLDDRIENFQILTPAENTRKSHPGGKTGHGKYYGASLRCEPRCDLCKEWLREYERKKDARKKARKTQEQ